jgi:hypothetical protein
MANQDSAEQELLTVQAAANSPPEARDVCLVTTQGDAIGVPVQASDPDGDAVRIAPASTPASGRVGLDPDGTLTFVPDQPGLQRFTYEATDGRGGADTAQVTAFVNAPQGELDQPVLQGLDDQQLARMARACAGGQALEVERLEGQSITVPVPAPGERIEALAQPGQQIHLQGGEFISATYLIAEGGLLVLTEDGRMVYVAGLVDAANSAQPPTLRVAGGPGVGSDVLLTTLQPLTQVAEGDVVGRLPSPQTGPEHWGGANFNPYDPGAIAAGPFPTGPLLPTALGLGTPPLLENQGLFDEGDNEGGPGALVPVGPQNVPPIFAATSTIERELGGITVTPQFTSAGPLPTANEGVRLPDGQINGVDQGNLTLGPSADATIVFGSELATFVSTLGVFLIDPNGQMVDPKIVFPEIEQAEADPNFPSIRPGGGPLAAGDAVALGELYDSSELHPGQQFGLFLIANGFRLNGSDLSDGLRFASDGHTLLTADGQPIAGNVFFTTDPTPGSPNDNPLNPDGLGHVVSGLLPDHAGLTIGFEDKLLSSAGDNDFNDVLIDVDLNPSVQAAFAGGAIGVALDATVTDPDDTTLSQASVKLDGLAGDALAFDGSLADTGVSLATSTPTTLVFEGAAPIADYVQILQSVTLEPVPVAGLRQIELSVVDGRGAASNTFVVNANLGATGAEVGTADGDTLTGQPLVDDAMSGLGGNDILSGDSGDDLLDGGTGNDILDGGAGNDQLIGGPGADFLSGGPGADAQIYFSLADRGDRISGFDAAEGDTLDFSELFDGAADPNNIDPFVHFDAAGDDIQVSVDQDGAGANFAFISFATLVDPSGVTTAQEAVNNNTLAV